MRVIRPADDIKVGDQVELVSAGPYFSGRVGTVECVTEVSVGVRRTYWVQIAGTAGMRLPFHLGELIRVDR